MAFTFLLAGCASRYHEPPRSADVAYLTATAPVWVVTIDGKAVSRAGIMGEKQFAVSPGNHLLELQYSGLEKGYYAYAGTPGYLKVDVHKTGRHHAFIPFTAQPGKHYYTHDGRFAETWQPYISENANNEFLDLPVR